MKSVFRQQFVPKNPTSVERRHFLCSNRQAEIKRAHTMIFFLSGDDLFEAHLQWQWGYENRTTTEVIPDVRHTAWTIRFSATWKTSLTFTLADNADSFAISFQERHQTRRPVNLARNVHYNKLVPHIEHITWPSHKPTEIAVSRTSF